MAMKGFPLEWCAHAQPKVAQYRPIGVFSPEMTSSNVTCRASPKTGSHVTGCALGVLSRTSGSYSLIIHPGIVFLLETMQVGI
jgi:hypothetical protein